MISNPKYKELDGKNELLVKQCQDAKSQAERHKIQLEILELNKNIIWYLINKVPCYVTEDQREDLYQEGRIAMMRAIDEYAEEREAKFSTYANKCCYREIEKYVERNLNVVKVHKSKKVKDILEDFKNERIKAEQGESDTATNRIIANLAIKYNVREEVIKRITTRDYMSYGIVEESDGGRTGSLEIASHSLDSLINDQSFNVRENQMASMIDMKRIMKQFREATSIKKPRDREIIDLIISGENMSDAGKKFGLSRERVRQIKDKTIQTFQRRLGLAV